MFSWAMQSMQHFGMVVASAPPPSVRETPLDSRGNLEYLIAGIT